MPTTLFTENFESITPPAVPSGFTVTGPWITVAGAGPTSGSQLGKLPVSNTPGDLRMLGSAINPVNNSLRLTIYFRFLAVTSGGTVDSLNFNAVFRNAADNYVGVVISKIPSAPASSGVFIRDSAGEILHLGSDSSIATGIWHKLSVELDGTRLRAGLQRLSDNWFFFGYGSGGVWDPGTTGQTVVDTLYDGTWSTYADMDRGQINAAGDTINSDGIYIDDVLLESFTAPPPTLIAGVMTETSHTDTSAILAWTAPSGGNAPVTAQMQFRPTGGSWVNVSGATTSPGTKSGLTASTNYEFRVAYTDATTPTAQVVYSNVVAITTDAAPPTLVAGTLSASSHTDVQIVVSWAAATGGTSPVTAQLSIRAGGSGALAPVSGATTSPATVTGLTAGTLYNLQVTYTDSAGTPQTATSNILAVTTDASPTVATGISLSGPNAGTTGVASDTFTAELSPVGGTLSGTVVVTPYATAGTFSPTSRSLTQGSPSGTFTYTRDTAGSDSVTLTNDRSLTNPASHAITISDPPLGGSARISYEGPTSGLSTIGATILNAGAEVWNGTAFIDPAAALSTYKLAMAEVGSTRLYRVDAPSLPAAKYDVRIYNQTTLAASGILDLSIASSGSGLTAQQTRDALKLAASVGSPAAGSIDAAIGSLATAMAYMKAYLTNWTIVTLTATTGAQHFWPNGVAKVIGTGELAILPLTRVDATSPWTGGTL